MLGEDVASLAAAGDLGEQQLVVVHADADRGRRDAVVARAGGDVSEAPGVDFAGIGVPVGEEQDGRAAVGGNSPRLLHTPQQAGGEVRHAARHERPDGVSGGVLVGETARGHDDLDVVVEGDDTEPVRGIETVHEPDERVLGGVEALAAHRSAAVEDDLNRRRGPRRALRRRGWRFELEHDRDLLLGFDGDDINISMCVHVHEVLL